MKCLNHVTIKTCDTISCQCVLQLKVETHTINKIIREKFFIEEVESQTVLKVLFTYLIEGLV